MLEALKKTTPKKFLSYILLGVLIVFITVLTWIPLLFDIEHLNFDKWITNSLINDGILIVSMILGEIFEDDKLKEKVGGLYQTSLKEFNDTLIRLTERKLIVYFSQFYIWFKERELKQKKEGFLVDHGFGQLVAHLIIKYIEKEDLGAMRAGVVVKVDKKTKKEIKFMKIDDEQYEVLKVVYSPDFIIDAPNYTFYLSAFGDSSSISILEQAKNLEAKERLNKTFNRTFKIVFSLFVSLIFGMATIQDITENNMKEAVANTLIRTLALISGLLGGVITSVTAVKLASKKLKHKTQVLTFMEIHNDNGDFRPKSYDELVEEELKKEEEEKAKVIIPDVIIKDEPKKIGAPTLPDVIPL